MTPCRDSFTSKRTQPEELWTRGGNSLIAWWAPIAIYTGTEYGIVECLMMFVCFCVYLSMCVCVLIYDLVPPPLLSLIISSQRVTNFHAESFNDAPEWIGYPRWWMEMVCVLIYASPPPPPPFVLYLILYCTLGGILGFTRCEISLAVSSGGCTTHGV
jgi:hypothetical protein